LALEAVLRCARKHFDQVVVQAVKELALESPLKLRMIQVAGMKLEIVGMNRDVWILEFDNDFDTLTLAAGGKVQQRMLVEAKLGKHAVETALGRFWHTMILTEPAIRA
jgi:hypothetical protein